MKPTQKMFKLNKVTYKRGQLYVEYNIQYSDGSEVHDVNSKTTYEYQPHIDLTNVLEMYKPMLATVFFYDKSTDVNEILSRITVTGISLNGAKEKRGLVITGKILSLNNRGMSLNSECIKYNSKKYGFEDSFEELEERLVSEVYEFIFNGKKGQLTMFTDSEMSSEQIEDQEEMEDDFEDGDLDAEKTADTDLDDGITDVEIEEAE